MVIILVRLAISLRTVELNSKVATSDTCHWMKISLVDAIGPCGQFSVILFRPRVPSLVFLVNSGVGIGNFG